MKAYTVAPECGQCGMSVGWLCGTAAHPCMLYIVLLIFPVARNRGRVICVEKVLSVCNANVFSEVIQLCFFTAAVMPYDMSIRACSLQAACRVSNRY